MFGQILDNLLAGKYERNCQFVGVKGLGERLPNGTYTEAKSLLQSNKAHMYR